MHVLLINPANPVISMTKFGKKVGMTKYRVWKPLSLLTLANVVPLHWEVNVVDENVRTPDYDEFPRPDLVGITAFTSQATRAYQLSRYFRDRGVPVVLGGIHASMCADEAAQHADALILGEAELEFPKLIRDVERNDLQPRYQGGLVQEDKIAGARHDLLNGDYFVGSIQTTRGCPLRCNFCSVTAFNGGKFRHRPVGHVIEELKQIPERMIFFVDDNVGGTRLDHAEQAKELFRAMVKHTDCKPWISQATINFADDDELLRLARQSGCVGIFIGFEAITEEGLKEVHKKFNAKGNRNIKESVGRIQKHGIAVTGNFIIGLDCDQPGIGKQIAETAYAYGLDVSNVLISTPLPGTDLFRKAEAEKRIVATNYPDDWQYYTLFHPVWKFKNLTWNQVVNESKDFVCRHQTLPKIFLRTWRHWKRTKNFFRTAMVLIANLSLYRNYVIDRRGW